MTPKPFGPWPYGYKAGESNVRPVSLAQYPQYDIAKYSAPGFDTGTKTIDDDTVDPEGRWWYRETTPAFLDYALPAAPDDGEPLTLKYSEDYFFMYMPFQIDYSFTIHPADADPGNRILGILIGGAVSWRVGTTHLGYLSLLAGVSGVGSYSTGFSVYLNDEDAGLGNKTYSAANAGSYVSGGMPHIVLGSTVATQTGEIDNLRFVFVLGTPSAGAKLYGTFRFRTTGDMYLIKYGTAGY